MKTSIVKSGSLPIANRSTDLAGFLLTRNGAGGKDEAVRRRRQAFVSLGALALVAACIRMPAEGPQPESREEKQAGPTYEPFELKPDFAGPCAKSEAVRQGGLA